MIHRDAHQWSPVSRRGARGHGHGHIRWHLLVGPHPTSHVHRGSSVTSQVLTGAQRHRVPQGLSLPRARRGGALGSRPGHTPTATSGTGYGWWRFASGPRAPPATSCDAMCVARRSLRPDRGTEELFMDSHDRFRRRATDIPRGRSLRFPKSPSRQERRSFSGCCPP